MRRQILSNRPVVPRSIPFPFMLLTYQFTCWCTHIIMRLPRFPLTHLGFNKLKYAAVESRLIEFKRMIANSLWIIFTLVKRCQRGRQALHCLFVEKSARHLIDNRGQRTTCSIGNHRSSRSLGFQGCDTEILFAGQDKCATVRVVVEHFRIGELPHETNRRPCHALESFLIASAPYNNQG